MRLARSGLDVGEALSFTCRRRTGATMATLSTARTTSMAVLAQGKRVQVRRTGVRTLPRVQARSAGREAEVERMQRIVQDCLAAVATGDVDSLEACIAEAKHETQTHETDLGLRAHSVACEAEAEMVLEDCLQAIADGDIDELRACLLEASSAVEGEGDE